MAGINWPGLMAWSTQYHDGTAPSQFKVMSAADREFLEKAMEEAMSQVEDPNKMMSEAIKQIKSEERTDEVITTALEIIDRCCDDPDVARNCEKLDGMQPLLDLVGTHPGPIRVRTLEVLALLFSNNTKIQEVGVRRGALKNFLDLLQTTTKGSEERTKAFRALVALVRQVADYETEFLRNQDGVAVLVNSMSLEEDPRMREKAASFVRSLCGDDRLEDGDVAPLAGAVAALLGAGPDMDAQNIQYRETVTTCAGELAHRFPAGCPAALGAAAGARLKELPPAKDGDDGDTEATILQECLDALAAGGSKPS